jgi:hypothetical protein
MLGRPVHARGGLNVTGSADHGRPPGRPLLDRAGADSLVWVEPQDAQASAGAGAGSTPRMRGVNPNP